MIPEDKKDAVRHALQLTFGVTEFEDIRLLTVGLSSALIFRIVVKSKPYLLRVVTRTDAMTDPTRWYDCMKAGADVRLAPQVWYTGAEDRISITDFVEAKPFPLNEARIQLPGMLKRLHSLRAFPFRINYLDTMDSFTRKFREAKILPESITGELFQGYEQIRKVYLHNESDLVSCHNDLKPENILFDGDKGWLVDWEAAFLNDRYLDLAVVANFVIISENQEKDYLERYFDEEVTEYQHARLFLMQQMLHVFYFTFFMHICATAGEVIDLDSPKPNFREFHNEMWAGKIDLKNIATKQQYAWVHLEQLRHNLQLQRFNDSLNIVSNHQLL